MIRGTVAADGEKRVVAVRRGGGEGGGGGGGGGVGERVEGRGGRSRGPARGRQTFATAAPYSAHGRDG